MSKAVITSVPVVERHNIAGFTDFISYTGLPDEHEPVSMLVMEPTFLEFKTATSDSLGLLFTVPELFKPEKLVLSIKYSQPNAKTMKGYLLDLCKYWKSKGYLGFLSLHMPYEGYGCPMVGSALLLILTKTPMAYVPPKVSRYPGQVWPAMVNHSLTGRPMSGVPVGFGRTLGMVPSNRTFLPNIDGWKTPLPCEFRDGESLKTGQFSAEMLDDLFGCSDYQNIGAFSYCTPKVILESLQSIAAFQTHAAA